MESFTSAYDQEFTFSRIGTLQRRVVWDYLDGLLSTPDMHVLELNCGTGTDAIHLATRGHRVVATDISEEMLKAAREKARQMGVEHLIDLEQVGFNDLAQQEWPMRFDMVLSDFGGLNCIDAGHLRELADPIADRLKPGGRFIAVLMPDRCLAETVHFFLRGQWSDAFRRGRHDPVWAALSGTGAVTWYHAPRQAQEAFASRFKVINVRPIAFFVPPTYFESTFGSRAKLLQRLSNWDRRIAKWRWTARYADHYLIDLERRA